MNPASLYKSNTILVSFQHHNTSPSKSSSQMPWRLIIGITNCNGVQAFYQTTVGIAMVNTFSFICISGCTSASTNRVATTNSDERISTMTSLMPVFFHKCNTIPSKLSSQMPWRLTIVINNCNGVTFLPNCKDSNGKHLFFHLYQRLRLC